KGGHSIQKFFELFVTGIGNISSTEISVYTIPSVSYSNFNRLIFFRFNEVYKGIKFKYQWVVNIPILKSVLSLKKYMV
ncbi:MAG: hypothetical protein R3254_11225, partial [Thiomicrorhabdus sp.]|nr:hypothetical protein [Thiomicrorhabdus sp.]